MPLTPEEALNLVINASHAHLESTTPQRFKVGDKVKVSRTVTKRHTRVPAYLRGCEGIIVKQWGIHLFADTRGHAEGDCPQPLYGVRFEKDAIWGKGGEAQTALYIDFYDSYLEPA
jgi:nitrile hydratase